MKKQIKKNLFVLLALIIISITAIGSVSASEDSQISDLCQLDSSNGLNDHFSDDIVSDSSDDDSDDDEYDSDDDDDDDDDDSDDDSDEDDDDDDLDDSDDDDDSDDEDDSDEDDDDDDLDDSDDDLDDDLDDYLDEDFLAYQDLVMRYHQLMENHHDVYSKLIPYIINIVNSNGNLETINFTDIFKDKNASNDEESSDDTVMDENPQENPIEEEISFENATQKLLELIENDGSLTDSNENLAIKLTGLVNDICSILDTTENFTADFKTYLENEISAENSTGESSEYLELLTFIYDLVNYAENHTDENFTLLDIFDGISKDYYMFLTSFAGGASNFPETQNHNSAHPIALNMKINDKTNQNGLNSSDNQNDTSTINNFKDNVSTQSINPINLIALLLILLIVIVGVKIKRDNN